VSRKLTRDCATCVLLFKGYATGPHHAQGGSGSNLLCLHEEPQWATYINGHQDHAGSVYGAAYLLFNTGGARNNPFLQTNSGGRALLQNPAPCAVCDVPGRSRTVMIPARTQCPDGWTKEYGGYMVSDRRYQDRQRSSYICLDEAPEIAVGDSSQVSQAVFHPVDVQCGLLPCSVYISGRELTCVVCSK